MIAASASRLRGRRPWDLPPLALLAALLCLGAAPRARAFSYDLDLHLGLGGHFYSTSTAIGRYADDPPATALQHTAAILLGGGFAPHRRVMLELELGLLPGRTQDGSTSLLVLSYRAQALVHILTGRLRPYGLVGGGGASVVVSSDEGQIYRGSAAIFHLGGGVKYDLTPRLGLRADLRALLTPSVSRSVTADVELSLGALLHLGPRAAAAADRDRDGVPDGRDRCPGEPEDRDGFEDEDGCPDPDDDHDGVPDGQDRCPRLAGPAESKGCPERDGDGDGVPDRLDRCPAQRGTRALSGCAEPDGDGDGVPDGLDRCPRLAGARALAGCPDGDGDGVGDGDDRCPAEPGAAALLGCGAAGVAARALALLRAQAEGPDAALRILALRALPPGPEAGELLRARLSDADPRVQLIAVELLGQKGDRAAGPALSALLGRATDLPLFLTTAGVLADWGDEQAARQLIGAQQVRDPVARLRAAALLARYDKDARSKAARARGKLLGAQAGLPPELTLALYGPLLATEGTARRRLLEVFESPSAPTSVRAEAAALLCRAGDVEARGKAQALAQAPGPLQAPLLRGLAELGETTACPRLLQLLRSGPREAQPPAAAGLGRCAGLDALAPLLAALEDGQAAPELRVAAAGALLAPAVAATIAAMPPPAPASARAPSALAALSPAAAAPARPRVAARASAAADREAAPVPAGPSPLPPAPEPLSRDALESYLRQQLEARDPALRLAALRALPKGALPAALRGRLADEDPAVQREALRLLRLRGDREAQADVSALLRRTSDARMYVRCAATLADWGDQRAAAELRGAARARDAAVRALALSFLAGRDASARRQLAPLLGAAPPEVALEAQRILSQQGDGEARARLREAMESPAAPPELRADLAEELVRAGDLTARTRLQELLRQDGPARGALARAAAVLGSGEACESLRAAAARGEAAAGERAEALRGLGACGLVSDEALLRSVYDGKGPEEALRIAAAGALLGLGRGP